LHTERIEVLEQFLEDVNEQIRYQPMHAAVDEELRGHVEDKALLYMEYGVEEPEAYKRAVRDMGDASALGIQMNQAHHLRIANPLLILILFLSIVLGLGGNIFDWHGLKFDDLYFVWGIFVLFATMLYGYPLLLKNTGTLVWVFTAGCIGMAGLTAVARLTDYSFVRGLVYHLFSPTIRFGMLQIAILVSSVLMYRNRKYGWKSLLALFFLEAVMIAMMFYSRMSDYSYIPILTMLISSFGIVTYMIGKGYLNVDKKKGIAGAMGGFLILLMFFASLQKEVLSVNLQMFVNPHARASVTTAWDDSYNNVLIRELFGRAEMLGEVELTKEELVRYGTSQWYYEEGPGMWSSDSRTLEKHIEYRMQFLEEPELEDILPEHYHNNYRIAYWILKFGWISAVLLLALVLATQLLMFTVAFRIHNRLGRLVAISGSITLCVQNVFYLLGNAGFQFGAFGNLPFISEGWVSITGTMIMAGLVLSAYRFDTVVKE